jgi:hypothetical protein
MSPVRIKYFGLISMTKCAYLVALAVAGGFALFVVLIGALLGLLPPLDTMWSREHHVAASGVQAWFHNYFYWFLVVCLIAEAIDVYCSLRQFAKKEKEQRAALDEMLRQGRADGGDE